MDYIVAINDQGYRIGEDHPKAKLTNHEVDLIIELREELGYSYQEIADKFEVSKSQVRNIIKGLKRGQIASNYKTVHLSQD